MSCLARLQPTLRGLGQRPRTRRKSVWLLCHRATRPTVEEAKLRLGVRRLNGLTCRALTFEHAPGAGLGLVKALILDFDAF